LLVKTPDLEQVVQAQLLMEERGVLETGCRQWLTMVPKMLMVSPGIGDQAVRK
jgi:hypothetical protein